MPPTNEQVAAAFEELADLIQLTGGDRFRVLAYRRAAATIRGLARDVAAIPERELALLRGIGKATALKVRELTETGSMAKLEELRAHVPPGVLALTELPGLGPKKAMLLHATLGIATLEDLREAIEAQRLRGVAGMGAKTEENLRRALEQYSGRDQRMLLGTALSIAERMLGELREATGIMRSSYAGSLRRMRETVGDVDLLVATEDPKAVMDAFATVASVGRVAARGPTKSSVITTEGIQVDLRAVAPDEYGAALQYFTGSKHHNVKVRENAVKRGLKLSEYGLFRVDGGERVAAGTEEAIYEALGMQTPPPPIRENRGEVELALRQSLPTLVEMEDMQGDLHSHSTYSDGKATLEQMTLAACQRGYRYYAITDHGLRLNMRSLTLEDIDRQAAEVRRLNDSLGDRITLLHGVEANIGRGGELDYPDDVLERFDVVVASLHHQLGMDREAMTRRILKAFDHRCVNIFGHPTARYIGRRQPAAFDLEAVFRGAADRGIALEINANPQRLDLKDDHILLAKELGCLLAIDTDAHSPSDFSNMRFGVSTAQRGWVAPSEVINAWPIERLRSFLAR